MSVCSLSYGVIFFFFSLLKISVRRLETGLLFIPQQLNVSVAITYSAMLDLPTFLFCKLINLEKVGRKLKGKFILMQNFLSACIVFRKYVFER